jgi:hypothetical protein
MRLLGLLPLGFFLANLAANFGEGHPGNSLWMCYLANLLLAAGLLLNRPEPIRPGAIWILPGIPLWLMDMISTGIVRPTGVLAHLGGAAVGIFALSRFRVGRRAWLHAFLLFLAVQQLCRWATPPDLNVNLAHGIYAGWEQMFTGYWSYWITTSVFMALALWITGRLLILFFPPHPVQTGGLHAHGAASTQAA